MEIIRARVLFTKGRSRLVHVFVDLNNIGFSAARLMAIREGLSASLVLTVIVQRTIADCPKHKIDFNEIPGVRFEIVEEGLLEILSRTEDSFFVSNDLYRNVSPISLAKLGIDQEWIETRRLEFMLVGRGQVRLIHQDLLSEIV